MHRFYRAHLDEEDFDESDKKEVEAVRKVVIPPMILTELRRISENSRMVEAVIDRFKDILYFKENPRAYLAGLGLKDRDILNYVVPLLVHHASHIVEVDVHANIIGDEGFIALLSCKQIRVLNIHSNRITEKGLEALAASQTLKHVNIGCNQIKDEALQKIALNESLTSFACPEFRNNRVVLEATAQATAERRRKLHVDRQLSFLMGGHPRVGQGSPILHAFFQHQIFEPQLINVIFSYLQPEKIEARMGWE